MSDDLSQELRAFEGSEALANGDFSVCIKAADRIEAQAARIAELEAALKDAAASVKEWGAYASAYLQEKWDLPGEVARYIAIAGGKKDE